LRISIEQWDRWRVLASLCAASLGVAICLIQQHFKLELDDRSLSVMTTHKCGCCMVIAMAWMVLEVAAACRRALGWKLAAAS
jgi:hypothetical protein